MMNRRFRLCALGILVAVSALSAAAAFSRRDVKIRKRVGVVSRMLDVDIGVVVSVDSKKWSCPLVCPLEVNVATPPRRKLDDVRSTVRLGCVGIDVVFAHYRGPGSLR